MAAIDSTLSLPFPLYVASLNADFSRSSTLSRRINLQEDAHTISSGFRKKFVRNFWAVEVSSTLPRNPPSLLKHFVQFPSEEKNFLQQRTRNLGRAIFHGTRANVDRQIFILVWESSCFDRNRSKYRYFDPFVCLKIIRGDLDVSLWISKIIILLICKLLKDPFFKFKLLRILSHRIFEDLNFLFIIDYIFKT